jgi:hypothetical protein
MKRNITFLAYVLTLTLTVENANAQLAGDYRTKTTLTNNNWFTVGNWETFDGTNWVDATHYPTAADGTITIRNVDGIASADSLGITGTNITLDQVVIEEGAKVGTYLVTITVNDEAGGDDIIANGRLYLGNSTIINGNGTIRASSSGWLFVRNNANLQVSAVNEGYGEFSGDATITNSIYTNNGTINWLDGFIVLSGSTFNNNGTLIYPGTALAGARILNAGTFNNNATGLMYGNVSGSAINLTNTVIFNNTGTIGGQGTIFVNVGPPAPILNNTGTLAPGNDGPGLITVNPTLITGKAVTLNLQMVSSTTPGTGHDRINVEGSAAVDISNMTLNIFDNPTAPVGQYTIMQVMNTIFPTFTGSFLTVNKPANYSDPVISPDGLSITIEKLSALPVTWGSFTARQHNGNIALNWTTLQEINVSHFIVEHSTDGQKYTAIGQVNAVGNSSVTNSYAFEHINPAHNGRNFYRILEVDFDGKSEYSVVRTIKMGDNSSAAVSIRTNPVQNGVLKIESELTDTRAILIGFNGAVLKEIRLHQGMNNVDVMSLPAGIYTISVFDNKSRIFSGRFVKN